MLKLILYNIFKHKFLYILIGSIVMLLAFYLVIGMNAVFSVSASLKTAIAENMTGDFIVVPASVEKIDVITKDGERGLPHLTGWQEVLAFLDEHQAVQTAAPRLRTRAMVRSPYNRMPMIVTGVIPEREKDLLPGRVLDSGEWPVGEREVIMYYRHSDQLSIEDGEETGITIDTLTGYSHFDTAVLKGRFDYQDIDYYSEYGVFAFITLDYLNYLLMSEEKIAGEIYIRLKDRGSLPALKADLRDKFGESFNYILPEDSSRLVNGIYMLTHFIIYFVTAVLMVMVIISCSFIVSLSIETRRQEIGIYQAIGVSRGRIAVLLGSEFLLVMFMFSLAGCLLALWAMQGISESGIRATIIPLHLVFGRSILYIKNAPQTVVMVFSILLSTFLFNVIYAVSQLGKCDPVEVMREL